MKTRNSTNQKEETVINEEETKVDNRFPLAALPYYILQKNMAQFLPSIEQDTLTRMGNRNLFCSFYPGSLAAKKQLLLHVAHGEKNQAEELMKTNPRLLLEKGTVEDYSGRKIFGTALQIALGAGDVSIHQKDEGLAEMIQRYLRMLPEGEAAIAKQQNEQFPNGYEEKEKERAKNDYNALQTIINAIFISNTAQDCAAAFDEFRNYLKPTGIIKTGKHFNTQLLADAFKAHEKNYQRFGGFGSYKNNLLWIGVIGYIQRFLPACDAQVFCDGLYNVIKDKMPLSRNVQMANGLYYYPLDSNSVFRLGFAFMVRCDERRAQTQIFEDRPFAKLCRIKTRTFNKLLKLNISPEKKKKFCVMQ